MSKPVQIVLILLFPIFLLIVLVISMNMKHLIIEETFDSDVRKAFKSLNININSSETRFGNLVGNGNKCVIALLYEVPTQDVDLPSLLNEIESRNIFPWNSILANTYVYKQLNNNVFRYKNEKWKKIEHKIIGKSYYLTDEILGIFSDHNLPSLRKDSYWIIVLDFTDTELDTLNLACN